MSETVDASLLRGMPLPVPAGGAKDARGSVAVVGGSREVPGAVLLAGIAALRAGAGRLRVGTVESRAAALGMALPEALVMALPENERGGLARAALDPVREGTRKGDALLLGPGALEDADGAALVAGLLADPSELALVLDAGALAGLFEHKERLGERGGRVVLTPHAGEMASLVGASREALEADPLVAAEAVARELGVVVAMKGAETFIAAPDGRSWHFRGGSIGLATSGSGDVLAGLIAGLLARGAAPAEAAVWGVYLHGEAGSRLAREVGTVGFLAREIADRVPRIMAELAPSS